MEPGLENLLQKWRWAADNDAPPPTLTEEQKRGLAREHSRLEEERNGIRGRRFRGLTYEQRLRRGEIGRRMGSIGHFLSETLYVEGQDWSPKAMLGYIQQVDVDQRVPATPRRLGFRDYLSRFHRK